MDERIIISVVRGVASGINASTILTIRGAERLKARLQAGRSAEAGQYAGAQSGVPASVAASQPHVHAPPSSPLPIPNVGNLAPSSTPEPSPNPVAVEHASDELDWAGSLSHATVASLHLAQVLAMVRAGWLIPDETRLADVAAALDAMEAFHERTDSAVGPVVDAMTEDQQAEFFEDFGADFPPELPDLDTTV